MIQVLPFPLFLTVIVPEIEGLTQPPGFGELPVGALGAVDRDDHGVAAERVGSLASRTRG